MQEKVVKEFLKEDITIVSAQELVRNLNNLKISYISLSRKSIYRVSDNLVITSIKTDYDHPLAIEKSLFGDSLSLYIDPDWYLDNQQQVDQLLCYIAQNINNNELNITSGCLINNNLIDSLCKNKNLETVDIGTRDDDGYNLNYNDYLKFKNSNIKTVNSAGVDERLKENFEPIVGHNYNRYLIGYYKYKDLVGANVIYLGHKITPEEIENLKYIDSSVNIQLSEESYPYFQEISKKLKELNKSNKVILDVDNKLKFNKFIFENVFEDDNVFVKMGVTQVPLIDYLKFEKIMYQMIESAKNLSPFEKYIYAYNLTKQFKKYKENEQEPNQARNLYSILINEYMVCVGYSNMFGDLLDKLGIENQYLSATVDISYDNKEDIELEEKMVEKAGHARRYIHIIDQKYGIDGFYVSDPTWDNDLENDYYNHLALTDKEAASAKRYLWINTYSVNELFNVNSIQEFYQKINFLLDRSTGKDKLQSLIRNIVKKIGDLDKSYANELHQKYKYINSYSDWPNDLTEIVYNLGSYIVNHVNKTISGDTIMNAVEVVYRQSYGYSEEVLQEKLIEVRRQNKERQEKTFPKRYREYEDGSKEIYDNETNKFNIEDISNKVI